MALASGDWRHRDRTRVPGRWKQSGRDLQHTGRGALATSAQSRCMNTVPQLALEAQPRQATTDVQLALNPSGAGRCAVATILLPHSPPPAGSVSLPSSLHSFALLPPVDSSRPTLRLPSATSPLTSTTATPTATTTVVTGGISSCKDSTVKDQPFTLASSFPPVPAKLVKRIQALEFVEMRELLPDNMALSARLAGLPSSSRQESYLQREIAGIFPWTCAFTTYVAVVAQARPERVKYMLAYMRLVVGTAQKFKEGRGWLTYDTVFRQNNQGPGARWDALDPSLYAAYVGGQGVPAVVICRYCTGADHPAESCALAPFFPSTKASLLPRFSPAGRPGRTTGLLCKSWNLGKCRFPGSCYYRHVCSTCGDTHRAKDCPSRTSSSGEARQPNGHMGGNRR